MTCNRFCLRPKAIFCSGQGSIEAMENSCKNFGDTFSKHAVECALNRDVTWAPPNSADLVSIGSVVELALSRNSTNVFWGTGLRRPVEPGQELRASESTFLAVRGPLTLSQLSLNNQVQIGEPGLLIRNWIPSRDIHRISGKKIYIPHFRTMATLEGRRFVRFAEELGFQIVHPNQDAIKVGKEISSSHIAMTSSLHGIVSSHSLGTPVLALEPAHLESSFKYQDYFYSLGLNYMPVKLNDVRNSIQNPQILDQLESEKVVASASAEKLINNLMQSISNFSLP